MLFNKLAKRNDDISVREISNGFIVTIGGRDDKDDWANADVYVEDMDGVENALRKWFVTP